MKILYIGLGSIGQRHLRNLASLGNFEHLAYRKRGIALPEEFNSLNIQIFDNLEKALAQKPDVAIISAPPVIQQEVLGTIVEAGIHFFIEKPIAPELGQINHYLGQVNKKNLVTMVGYNLRYHPVFSTLQKLINQQAIGKIVSVRASVGMYLPDWHPWEDYRQGYSANTILGGGVVLDLIHEIDFVYGLFGPVKEVKSLIAKNSDLEINTEDTAEIILRFESGIIGSIHLDYVQRVPFRNGMIIGEEGTIIYDLLSNTVEILKAGRETEVISFPGFVRNEMYLSEMKNLLAAIHNGSHIPSDFRSGVEVLKIAMDAKNNN